MPHIVDWEDSWAVFFGKLLRNITNIDLESNGLWPEMQRATDQIISKVVPRLLGNLTQNGDPIKPSLLHGDIWEPNLGISIETEDLIMYDAGSYYGHNEMDLANWQGDFCSYLRSRTYTRQYLRRYPAAEPAEEFEDRNRLYSLKGAINYSAGHPGCITRQT